MGLHSQDLFDHNRPIVSHNSRCRNSGFCPSDRSLLRQQWGRPRSLHRNHHHSLHRYVLQLRFQLFCFSILSLEVLLIFDYDFFFFWGVGVSVVSLVLLPPEAPGELRITWDFYRLACLCGWIDLCIYQW